MAMELGLKFDEQAMAAASRGRGLIEAASDMVINSHADEELAVRIMADAAGLVNIVEERAKPFEARVRALLADALAQRNILIAPMREVRALLEGKVLGWRGRERDRMRAEAVEIDRLNREHAEQQKLVALERLRAQGKPEATIEAAERLPVEVRPSGTALPPKGGSVERRVFKWEPVDEDAVPRTFTALDKKKITSFVNTFKDKAVIPGIRIWSEVILAVRASKLTTEVFDETDIQPF